MTVRLSLHSLRARIILNKLLFLGLLLFVFIANTLHDSYPDEFDNILGGWYILHGKFPFTGFFSHHGPVSYWLAAGVSLLSGQSFVRFRIIYAFVLLGLLWIGYFYLKRAFKVYNFFSFYPVLILIFGLQATYSWSHMLLADNLSAVFLLPVFVVIFFSILQKKLFNSRDLWFISIMSALGLYTSLAYLYLVAIIYAYCWFMYVRHQKNFIHPTLILAAPHFFYLGYLVLTGSLFDYIYQSIIFNSKYYASTYSHPENSTVNPLRFAIVIAQNFFMSFSGVLPQIKDFNFSYPVNVTLALADVCLFIYLALKKHFRLLFFVILFLIFGTVRSSPLESGERDYQAAVYIVTSLFIGVYILFTYFKLIKNEEDEAHKTVFRVLFVLLSFYFFFTLIFYTRQFTGRVYTKYMGTAPLIYDRPSIAPVINSVVSDDDYMWIGPFEFEELFYARGKLPSKYHILIPGIGKSEKIQHEMIADFEAHKPKVIYFDPNFSILGHRVGDYSQFFVDFLDRNYITLLPYRNGNKKYVSVRPIHEGEKVDLETKLFIRLDAVDEVVSALVSHNQVREIESFQ